MADPVVWGALPKTQTDATTIDDAIAAAIAVHNADPDAHLEAGGSLQSHKASEIIDHEALSVVADKLVDDQLSLLQKIGGATRWANSWTGQLVNSGNYVFNVGIVNIGYEVYVAITSDSKVYTSTNRTSWSTSLTLTSGWSGSVTTDGTHLVIIEQHAGTNQVHYTTNLTSWSTATINSSFTPTDVAYNGTAFIVVGNQSTNPRIYRSTNLTSWTQVYTATGFGFSAVTVDASNAFFAVNATEDIYRSTDGTSWSVYSTVPNSNAFQIDYYAGVYIIEGYDAASTTKFYTSLTAQGWTAVPLPPTDSEGILYKIAHGAGSFLMLTYDSTNSISLLTTSFNGTYIQTVYSNDSLVITACAASDNYAIFATQNTSGSNLYISTPIAFS